MKILAFTDTHGSYSALKRVKKAAKKEKPDLILMGGDITIFGNELDKLMNELDKINQEVLIIHGNHETAAEMRKACDKTKNIKFFSAKTRRIGKFFIIGFSVDGFSLKDPDFDRFIKRIKPKFNKDDKIILLSHGPPYGTKVDLIIDQHCGSKSLKKFIGKYHPVLVISGHLHETFNKSQNLGNTLVINPGPYGKILDIK